MDTEERNKLVKEVQTAICKCGHCRNTHSKYINGLFVGCQSKDCMCEKFEFIIPVDMEKEKALVALLFDEHDEVHTLVMSWLNESLKELNP